MDRIRSEDLRDFLTVAEEGDFARASQRLGRHPMLLKESVRGTGARHRRASADRQGNGGKLDRRR